MNNDMMVLGFDDYRTPALALADALGCACEWVNVHRFPDGESRVRLPAALPPTVVLMRTLADPNAKLVELLLAAETARTLGAQRVILVAPYLCYMRQDIAFNPGEAVSQRIIGRWLADVFDVVVTVDPHLHRIERLDQAVPGIPAISLSAAMLMGERLRARAGRPLLVGPDEESRQWVAQVAAVAQTDFVVATKQRHGDRDVEITLPNGEYAGRVAVLVDDVIASGRTLMVCARLLRDAGCVAVGAMCTHALLAGDAAQGLRDAGISWLESTDAVLHESNVIGLAQRLAEAVRAV